MIITRSFLSLAALCFLATPLHPSRLVPLTPSQKVAASAGAVAAVPLLIMLAKKIAKKRLSKAEKAIYGTISGLGFALAAGALARDGLQAHRQQPARDMVYQSARGNQTASVYRRAEEQATSSAFQVPTTGADHRASASSALQIPTTGPGAPMAIEGLAQRIEPLSRQVFSISGNHLIEGYDGALSCTVFREDLLFKNFPRLQLPTDFTPTEAVLAVIKDSWHLIILSAQKTVVALKQDPSQLDQKWQNNTDNLMDSLPQLIAYTQNAALIKLLAARAQPIPSSAIQGPDAAPQPPTPDEKPLMTSAQQTDEAAVGTPADAAPGRTPTLISRVNSHITNMIELKQLNNDQVCLTDHIANTPEYKAELFASGRVSVDHSVDRKDFNPSKAFCIQNGPDLYLLMYDQQADTFALFNAGDNHAQCVPSVIPPADVLANMCGKTVGWLRASTSNQEIINKIWPENPDRAPTPIV